MINENTLIPLLNKYTLLEKDLKHINNSIMANNLVVKYNYYPKNLTDKNSRLLFIKDKFKWENDFEEYNNLAMLHLHSLEPISYLLVGHNLTGNIKYLEKSYEIFFDWCKHADISNHFYLWYRHCVSDRALIISQLFILKNKVVLTDQEVSILQEIFFEHKIYLLNRENYISHNHGTLMDIGLVALSLVSGDKISLNYSINRVASNFKETFTESMICVENSVSYSLYNLEQFIKCEKYLLKPIDRSIIHDFDRYIEQGLDFFEILMQPNGSFPHLGDGERINIDRIKGTVVYEFYNKHKIFNSSNATEKYQVYYEEGYAIFKNKSNYIFITAGDIKKNHKHADDTSFVLYYDEDIFIDPGIYSYDNDQIREYLSSSVAHNSVSLDNESYNYIDKNNSRIIFFNDSNDYYYIVVKNGNYEFADIYRHIYVMKNDFTVIIHDEVYGVDKLLATQNFNFGENFSSTQNDVFSESKIIINNKFQVVTDQNSLYEMYNGKNPYLINAIYAERFHEIQPIKKLAISKFSENPYLTTIISNRLDKNFKVISNSKDEHKISIVCNNQTKSFFKKSYFKEQTPFEVPFLKIERLLSSIKCKTVADYYSNQEYAWDIFKNNEKVDLIWYQNSNEFNYKFIDKGIYTIRCYVRNIDNNDEKTAFMSSRKIII